MRRLLSGALLAFALLACSVRADEPADTPTPNAAAPPWARLSLAGRLIFTQSNEGVWELDLATGARRPLFQPAQKEAAWVNAAAVSPDGQAILIAYAPPPPPGEIQFGYTDLYVMPADGSAPPQPFLTRARPRDSLFNPVWSPDGRHVYFAQLTWTQSTGKVQYTVERVGYPAGAREVVATNAYWPRLSADGQSLVYVTVDPDTLAGTLMIAAADGAQARALLDPDAFPAVDAPLFTPDGAAVVFSAVSGRGAARGEPWWERWGGVQVAEAHNVPSDWWQVPVDGGAPVQLTQVYDVGLYGDFAPDGRYLAFISQQGLHVMRPDGTSLITLASPGAFGTVDWVP